MILVDSSVWIDYFRGTLNPQTERLNELLDREFVCIGDLILAEVLQGFRNEQDFRAAKKLLTSLLVIDLGRKEIAIQSAKNFRLLRSMGATVRKTVDSIIATRCIESGYILLHNDRDFDPFVRHLGLQVAI